MSYRLAPCLSMVHFQPVRLPGRSAALLPAFRFGMKICAYFVASAHLCVPHSAIRSKVFSAELAQDAPPTFKHIPVKGEEFDNMHVSYQVAPEDCTGCDLCVDVCPARDKSNASHKALNMQPQAPLREQESKNWEFFLQLPEFDRRKIRWSRMKSAMLAEPLFEFSGACLGCGETPYIRLATQLFGDRMIIANATGCSSIYGGNLPTTPLHCQCAGQRSGLVQFVV